MITFDCKYKEERGGVFYCHLCKSDGVLCCLSEQKLDVSETLMLNPKKCIRINPPADYNPDDYLENRG